MNKNRIYAILEHNWFFSIGQHASSCIHAIKLKSHLSVLIFSEHEHAQRVIRFCNLKNARNDLGLMLRN